MDNQNSFSLILENVKLLFDEINKKGMYKNGKFDTLNNQDYYKVNIEFDNCIGEVIVNRPNFAPYRYVKIEILSSIRDDFEYVFVWYDCDENSVEEILSHIREGLEIASKYN